MGRRRGEGGGGDEMIREFFCLSTGVEVLRNGHGPDLTGGQYMNYFVVASR